VIGVPDVPADEAGPGDAESHSVAAHPEFQRVIAEGREAFAWGEGLDAEDVFRELGVDELGTREEAASPTKGGGTSTNGQNAARRSHTPARPK